MIDSSQPKGASTAGSARPDVGPHDEPEAKVLPPPPTVGI